MGFVSLFTPKLKVPEAPQVTPTQIAQGLFENYRLFEPQAQAQAAAVNRFNIAQTLAAANRFGGLADLFRRGAGLAKTWMRGELPADVVTALRRAGAAQALGAAPAGSSFGWSMTPLSLGLTSLQLQQSGLGASQNLWNQFQQAYRPFDYTSTLMPDWTRMAALQQWNEEWRYNRGLAKAKAEQRPSLLGALAGTMMDIGVEIVGKALGALAGKGLEKI